MRHATGSQPQRSTSSIVVAFGIINIPLSVYATTEETRVARKEFTKDGHAVGRASIDKETNEIIDTTDVIRKAEASDGTWVELTDEEIAAATGHSSGVAEIVGRIPLSTLHNELFVENIYQVRPKSDKKAQTANDAAFALLMTVLEKENQGAVIRTSLRGSVAKWAVLTSDGYMRVVHSVDQMRKERPMPATAVDGNHLAMAETLFAMIPVADLNDMVDDSSALISAYVETKVEAGGPFLVRAEPKPAPAIDLMAQLTASITAVQHAKAS